FVDGAATREVDEDPVWPQSLEGLRGDQVASSGSAGHGDNQDIRPRREYRKGIEESMVAGGLGVPAEIADVAAEGRHAACESTTNLAHADNANALAVDARRQPHVARGPAP